MASRYPLLALSLATLIVATGTSRAVIASAASRAPSGIHSSASVRPVHESSFRRTSSGGYVYVANVDQSQGPFVGSVLIYPVGSSGNVAPIATITGSNTLLTQVDGIVVDGSEKSMSQTSTPIPSSAFRQVRTET